MRTLTPQQQALLIEKGWLSLVPSDFQRKVIGACRCYDLRAGEAVTNGGEIVGGMYGVVEGAVDIFSAIGAIESPLLHIAGPTFWFGLFPLTVGGARIISVTARSSCIVTNVPQAALYRILDDRPEMWRWLNLLSLESSKLAVQALSDVLIRDKYRRCAAVLLRIADCRDSGDAPTDAILTQNDLAALSNVSRATASFVLGKLASEGLISLGYGTITILLPKDLRRFADAR